MASEIITLVIYDVEDDWARNRVSEACKDVGLKRVQYSCFRGRMTQNKREELYERFRKIQRDWQKRWLKAFPEANFEPMDSPDIPQKPAKKWQPAFKIMIQPLCEKDVAGASYAYLYLEMDDATAEPLLQRNSGNPRQKPKEKEPPFILETARTAGSISSQPLDNVEGADDV